MWGGAAGGGGGGGGVLRARETRQAVQRRGCLRSDFKAERNLCVISACLKLQIKKRKTKVNM